MVWLGGCDSLCRVRGANAICSKARTQRGEAGVMADPIVLSHGRKLVRAARRPNARPHTLRHVLLSAPRALPPTSLCATGP